MRLIDANEFKKRIDHYPAEIRDIAKKELRYVHTIEAEPNKYGKWTITECFDVKDMTCSSCGWLYEYYAGMEEEWNYCPHCGARMNDEISNIAKESADKISKALDKVRAKGMQKQNIKEDDEP